MAFAGIFRFFNFEVYTDNSAVACLICIPNSPGLFTKEARDPRGRWSLGTVARWSGCFLRYSFAWRIRTHFSSGYLSSNTFDPPPGSETEDPPVIVSTMRCCKTSLEVHKEFNEYSVGGYSPARPALHRHFHPAKTYHRAFFSLRLQL